MLPKSLNLHIFLVGAAQAGAGCQGRENGVIHAFLSDFQAETHRCD